MTNKPIIECVKEYFKTCPYLKLLGDLDESDGTKTLWSIDPIEVPIIIGTNVLRNKTHRQFEFMIVTDVFDPSKDLENLKNLHLFENITEWVHENIKNKILPSLNENEEVTDLTIETGEFSFSDDYTSGIYRIICKMLYDKEEK